MPYFPPGAGPLLLFVPGPTLPSLDGLRAALPFWEPFIPVPVVMPAPVEPDFILEPAAAPGPTLPSLDAPGAGVFCADAIAVAPNSEVMTRAEIASLNRMVSSVDR